MLTKHPKKYMVGYILVGLWNLAAGLHPGGVPTWLSFSMVVLMGLMVVVCFFIICKQVV